MGSNRVSLPAELLQLEQTLCEDPQMHNKQKIAKQAQGGHRYLEGFSMLLSDLLIFATLHHFVVSTVKPIARLAVALDK